MITDLGLNMLHFAENIFITGHTGLLGAAILRRLVRLGHPVSHIVTRRRDQLDLSNQAAVRSFFEAAQPDQVYLNMADPCGHAPQASSSADILQQRLSTQAHVIEAAFHAGVKKLLLITGSDVYPVTALQPMAEEDLATGPLNPASAARAAADLVGIQLCESYNHQYGQSHGIDYRCALTCETYGPGDHYAPDSQGIVAALIRLLHDAATRRLPVVHVDGHALARHETLFVDDLAEACIYVMEIAQTAFRQERAHSACINVGSGTDHTLRALAQAVANAVGYQGDLVFGQEAQADAPQHRLLDVHRLNALGWTPLMELDYGLEISFMDYKLHHAPRQVAAYS